jgi:RNA polymerase sigma factor (sigma-70 family)
MASFDGVMAAREWPVVSQTPEDDVLLQRCRDGDRAAWSILVRRYQRLIYTVPRRAGLSDEACADVFQSTFGRLFEHLDRIDDGSRVRAWLVTTARRESLRLLEEARRQGGAPGSRSGSENDEDGTDEIERIADPGPLPEALLSELQDQHRVREAVDRLDPRSRQFVELMFLQEEPLPYGEVARRMGMAEGSIGPTRARCLEKLRVLLQESR